MIDDIIFIVLNTIAAAWGFHLSVKGESLESDKIHKKQSKRFTNQLISLFGFIMILGIIQAIYNNYEQRQENKALKIERDGRDSIIQAKVEESSKNLFENLSLALSKQSLKLDTFNRVLIAIDSVSRVPITEPNYPILTVKDDGTVLKFLNQSTIKLSITLSSFSGPSYGVKVSQAVEITYSDGSVESFPIVALSRDAFDIPMNLGIIYNNTINNIRGPIREITYALYGTFKTSKTGKNLPFKEVYKYTDANQTTATVNSQMKQKFIAKYKL